MACPSRQLIRPPDELDELDLPIADDWDELDPAEIPPPAPVLAPTRSPVHRTQPGLGVGPAAPPPGARAAHASPDPLPRPDPRSSPRTYAARLELVLDPRTPLPLAMSQLHRLRVPDLRRVAAASPAPDRADHRRPPARGGADDLMTGLLARIGGMLVAPRRLLADMSPETGRHDGAALLGAYLLAVAVLPIGDVIADFWALRSLAAAPGLLRALLPALPWLLTAAALDWLLGPGRAHRAALCLAPLLVIDALAHLLTGLGLPLPGPSYLAPALGGLAALLLAARVRGAIPPTPAAPADLSPGTASSAPADLSPGTASPAPADMSPRDSSSRARRQVPRDSSSRARRPVPGTAPPAPDDLSPGTASPAPAAHVPKDMPPRTPGRARLSQVVGGLVLALVAARALTDLKLLKDRWPTLAPVAVGDPLPEFAVPLLDGGSLRSADLRGRPHLLIFWTTWCGVCDAEMPMYRALAERYAARGLAVVAVNADREGDVPALVRAHRDARGLPFPIALDDRSMVRRFRVEMFPHLVLIDAAGQIRRVHQGRSFERDLAAAIEAVLP